MKEGRYLLVVVVVLWAVLAVTVEGKGDVWNRVVRF